tara:strand:- start:621 stop:1310 length:690 start_codon:yes stop_codon:yes gene_type:complete
MNKKNKDTFNEVYIQYNENTIVNIKPNSNIDKYIQPFNPNDVCFSKISKDYVESDICWNCCHSITKYVVHIPFKYVNNIFYIHGSFCSYECGGKYILDNYHDKYLWDIYSLLNLYYNISNGTIGEYVIPAPSRLLLKMFGGDMEIIDYRANFKKKMYSIYLPPILPIKHKMYLKDVTKVENKHNYKLYRKKPINNDNNIYNTMNLVTNDNEGELENEIEHEIEHEVEHE